MATATKDRRAEFLEEGFLIVEDLFDPATDFAPLHGEWQEILDGIVDELCASGDLGERFDDLPFAERLIAVCAASGRNVPQPFDISLPQKNIRLDTPIHVSPTIFSLLTNEALLDVVEELIGPEITSNPIQHLRMKLPAGLLDGVGQASYLTAKVPWHQDWGVLLPSADEATIVSCWVALTDATERNGCLQVVRGSHRDALLAHCPKDPQPSIPDKLLRLENITPLPMRAGSAMFFGRSMVHSSLANLTADQVRISMDLRYQPTGQPSGRPQFPSFVARSRSDPSSVLRDPASWAQRWYEARAHLAEDGVPAFNRWDANAAVCA